MTNTHIRFLQMGVGILLVLLCAGCVSPNHHQSPSIVDEGTATDAFQDSSVWVNVGQRIRLPEEKPPLLSSLGDWESICLYQQELSAMSGPKKKDQDVLYFTKAKDGYLYSNIIKKDADKELAENTSGQQNVFPLNNLHRIHENSNSSIASEENLFLAPQNEGWRIGYFDVSDHYLWWCELKDQGEPRAWRLYEKELKSGQVNLISEDPRVENLQYEAPSRMTSDQDRLVFQAYDSKSKKDIIYLRLPLEDKMLELAEDARSEENPFYFYDPKIDGNYVVWAKSKSLNMTQEEGRAYLYEIDSQLLHEIASDEYSFVEPIVADHHLLVRVKPEGQNYIENETGYQSAEIWHYDLNQERWDFRIDNTSPIYKDTAFKPITLYSLDAKGHYLTWQTEPVTEYPLLVDLDEKVAYPIPISQEAGIRIIGMNLVENDLYWKTSEANSSLNKASLR